MQLRTRSRFEPPSPAELAGAAGPDGPGGIDRREFMRLVAASAALASGCARDVPKKILPYTSRPPEVTPGVATYYATSFVLDGYATGVLVESHEGRPTKIEGNPEHPASLGATGVLEQASILPLYDGMRGRRVRRGRDASTWEALLSLLARPRDDAGAGLRLVLPKTTSPLVHALLDRVLARHPRARVTFFSPIDETDARAGARLAFHRPLEMVYDFERADAILVLDGDPLGGNTPFSLRYARQFAGRRRPASPASAMNRLYVVECIPSPTGMMADHRIRRRSGAVLRFAEDVYHNQGDPDARRIAADLAARPPGTTLVVAGERQPAAVHAIAHAMNAVLGNLGETVRLINPVIPEPGPAAQELGALAEEMKSGVVRTLIVAGCNPAYAAPVELDFGQAMRAVPESICLDEYEHETAVRSIWYAPLAHYLESWGDARAKDGTYSLIQPLISPLFGGRTLAECLAALAGDAHPDAHRLLRSHFAERFGDDPAVWERALARGLVEGAEPHVPAAVDIAAVGDHRGPIPVAVELDFYPSPTVYDGRFTNNVWLLELPEPATKLTWDNAALMSVATAARLGVESEQLVEIESAGRTLRLPAFVVAGAADDAIAIHLGWGRDGHERLAAGRGFNAYSLRTGASPWIAPDARVKRVRGRHRLAQVQQHFRTEGREIVPTLTLDEYRRNPGATDHLKGPLPSILPDWKYEGLQWAMSIDLSICTGCSACVVACQAENNILPVGKENVIKGRAMHWLRIDTYHEGSVEDPGFVHQPMLCQHCELAPCEYVCPVNATDHSPDGLNEMIYNRCVGTRFCSNNCPYKVRRFNWFDWRERRLLDAPANSNWMRLQYNPDVTVRERGVMEKCTYCVQRIRRAEIQAEIEKREVRPGDVVTACAQACPTGAIQFGSLSHEDTEMVRRRREPRSYEVLHELNTRPRTMYLARVSNPNPAMGK